MASKHINELTELEKKVIEKLSLEGPKCGYDFHLGGRRQRGNRKALMSSGKWDKALPHLGDEGLKLIIKVHVRKPTSTDERGRRKDLYWLTPQGVEVAVLLGVNRDFLAKNIKAVYKGTVDERNLLVYVEMSKLVSNDVLAAASYLGKPQSNNSFINLLAPQLFKYSQKDARQLIKSVKSILRSYPEFDAILKETTRSAMRNLKEVTKIVDGEEPSGS